MPSEELVIFNFPSKPPHWLCEFVKHYGFTWSNNRKSWSAYKTAETQEIARDAIEMYEKYGDN